MPKSRHSKPKRPANPKWIRDIMASTAAFTKSKSSYEENHWIRLIDAALLKLLDRKKESDVVKLVDEVGAVDQEYSALLFERVQYLSEFTTMERPDTGELVDCLLVTVPTLVWTRYTIPDVTLGEKETRHLIDGLKQHVFASDVQLYCLPRFLSPFEMPLEFTEIRQWLTTLSRSALQGDLQWPKPAPYPEGISLLADSRHLIMVAIAPHESPAFKWMLDPDLDRAESLHAWQQYANRSLVECFPGCQVQALIPDVYSASTESAQESLRPIGIRASIDWLQAALNITAAQLRANIMRFGDDQYREFRIGYSRKGDADVFFGTIWPTNYVKGFSDEENDDAAVLDQLTASLNAAGIRDVRVLPGLAPIEFCSDCGTAMLPNQDGEIVHPEMPDEAFELPQHFH